MKIVKKIFQLIREIKLHGFLGNIYNYISPEKYMKSYTKALKKRGINIVGNPKFISNSVWFDGNDYSKITIGDNVTISKEVMLLTHDYSITTAFATAFATIGKKIERGGGVKFIFLRQLLSEIIVLLGLE